MSLLDAPGAKLYYKKVGNGPLLLCISGANGDCDIWRGFAECLKEHFTVLMYDRRGFSRSYLTGEQDYDHRLETDADDAALLIKEFSPNEPATVIGNSSGAIVSLRLLTRHPDIIRTLIPYEPPAAKLIPEFDQIWAKHEETYDLYRKKGPKPALKVFAELTKADQRMIESFDLSKPTIWSNLQYWFEREFMFYPKADFDVECEIRPLKEKLMPIYGESSPKEAYQYRAMEVMCKQLGLEYVGIPGEHVAQATHAPQFAQRLREALKAKDQYYAAL